MGSYKWALQYKCEDEDIKSLLTNFGFEKEEDEGGDDEEKYTVEVNGWNPLQAEITKKGELEFVFYWMGESTTEVYYDYLIHCGVLMGQLMVAIDDFSK